MKEHLLNDATIDHFVARYVAIIKNIINNGRDKKQFFSSHSPVYKSVELTEWM